MRRPTLERLCYIAAHRILAMESIDSLAIPGKQYATQGRRRSLIVDRIAASIADVFDGTESAELAHMMDLMAESAPTGDRRDSKS